ncbi:MAG: MATE family efflux transporter [Pseudomonadota bacterium]
MTPRLTYRDHAAANLRLGVPLIMSHLAQMSITLSDAVMLGWYSVEALAAEVLGGMLFYSLFVVGSGFAWAVMPMVAAAQSSGNQTQVRRITRMGGWLSVLFSCVMLPAMIYGAPIFRAAGQDPAIGDLAGEYTSVVGWALTPALLVMVLKCYLSALERTQVVMWVTLAALPLNILVNYVLIFGNWGAPELGVRGAAVASLVVTTAAFLVLAVYAARVLPEHALFSRIWRPDWEAFGAVFRLGWPIGLTNLAEVGLFAASTVMMGWLGKVPLAAHGIALQITSVTFMVHMGLSNAATVRAGQAFGRHDLQSLRDGSKVVLALSVGFALVTVALLLLFPKPLIELFMHPSEPEKGAVLAVGVGLLAAAALFQLMDGAQVMALGLLRGVQDTRVPMVIAAISYWLIGVPVSYWLGFVLGLDGVGIWLGLALGLALAAVCLLVRFWAWTLPRLDRKAVTAVRVS